MEALGFGLAAAMLWAVHDLLTRKLSQGQALLPLISVVLAAGCVTLLPFAADAADWQAMTAAAWGLALASGLAFAVAIGSLYRAFSLAPVRPKYLAVQNSGYEPLLQYGNTVLQDRIMFGTSYPLLPVERSIQEIEALPLKDASKRKWLHDNAARFLRVA